MHYVLQQIDEQVLYSDLRDELPHRGVELHAYRMLEQRHGQPLRLFAKIGPTAAHCAERQVGHHNFGRTCKEASSRLEVW